jgi:hypothetical protein
MKLEIFWLIEAHFWLRSIATEPKIAEKQAKKINFWPDGLPPQQLYYKAIPISTHFLLSRKQWTIISKKTCSAEWPQYLGG